ncbi:hypothetical protein Gpo141_00002115 [Globisporangium polare]
MSAIKHRVLCLHGYRQTGAKLHVRISGFRRAFKSSVEFVCVDAPLVVPYEPTSEEHIKSMQESESTDDDHEKKQFSWWNYHVDKDTGAQTYSEVEEAIDYVASICKEQGPFDGVFGFSQGGMLAAFVLQRQFESPENSPFAFSFGIFAAAPQSIDPRFGFSDIKLSVPSLHLIGETDTIVSPERCKKNAEGFVDPKVLLHAGGHYIPANKESKDAFRDFFKQLDAPKQ